MFSPNPGQRNRPCRSQIFQIFSPIQSWHFIVQSLYLRITSEPVDVKYFGHAATGLFHLEPMLNVFTGVVAEERSGRKRIVHHFMSRIFCSWSRLGAHRCSYKHAVLPIKRFVNQRDTCGPSSTKDDGCDRYSCGIFPFGIYRRALRSWHTKSEKQLKSLKQANNYCNSLFVFKDWKVPLGDDHLTPNRDDMTAIDLAAG